MKKGEWVLAGLIAALLAGAVVRAIVQRPAEHDREIPFYSTAAPELAAAGGELVRHYSCRDCHSLWSTRNPMQAVPAPMLDGIGALRSEPWLYAYLSAANPQATLPTRLKPEYRMPSFAALPEAERRTLARYLASLQVRDWFLDQTRRLEHDQLTGEQTAQP